MESLIDYSNTDMELLEYSLSEKDEASIRITAILALQYLMIDDRQPATLQDDGLTISPDENERRTSASLEDLIENRFGELFNYGHGYCVIALKNLYNYDNRSDSDHPLLFPLQNLRELPNRRDLEACFNYAFSLATILLKKILERNLIIEMPSYTYDRENRKLRWKPIKYRDGKNWLSHYILNSNNSELQSFLNEKISPAQNSAPVCWPGDTTPTIEPHSVTHNLFSDAVGSSQFSNMLWAKELAPKVDNDLLPHSYHHIISRNLMFRLFKQASKIHFPPERQPCLQISRRVDNLIDYNRRKISSVLNYCHLIKAKKLVLPESIGGAPPDNFPKSSRLDNTDQYRNFEGRRRMWGYSANLMIGPQSSLRGPFDPSVQKSDPDFETKAEPILGPERYAKFYKMYVEIRNFVNSKPEAQTAEKYNIIIDKLRNLFAEYDKVPFDKNQWIERYPTEDELNQLKKGAKKTYAKNRKKKFWAIKTEPDTISRPASTTSETSTSSS